MTTSTSWTLWKRLPPRYQLSVRTFVEEDDGYPCSPPGSPKQQRRGSPRHARSENKSPGPQAPASPLSSKRSIQNIPYMDPEQTQERPTSPSGAFFPFRRSGYIDHFKTQQRVNSARVNMMAAEGMNRSRSPSPTGRISRIPSQQENKPKPDGELRCVSAKTRSTEQPVKKCEHQNENANKDSKGDTQSLHSNKMEQRKYLVRETNEGTMYIDRGKVIYFRSYKSSPVSQTPHMSRYNDGGYLASIRREYLTKPRLLAMGPDKKTETGETHVHEERANYNRKVAHILDYYSYPDEDYISVDDLTKYTSANRRPSPPRKQINMNTRNVKRIYFTYPKSENESRVMPIQEFQQDMGSYFKVNQQSKLHDRNFYLKTPAHKSTFPEAGLDCSCGMCRIEMQLALMAQAEAENLAKLQQAKLHVSKTRGVMPKTITNTTTNNNPTEVKSNPKDMTKELPTNDSNKTQDISLDLQKQSTTEDTKQEQTLTVTIPKMDTNREISEVAKENEATTENLDDAKTT